MSRVRGIRNDGGMPTYVAFLRAINLGPTRKFPKDDIRRVVEDAGFTDVDTHINTGNVRFSTPMRSRAKIEARLEQAFAADRGFDVPAIVFSTAELAEIAREAAGLSARHPELERHYVYLMKDELPAGTVDTLLKPESKADLTAVLTYHVVRGNVDAATLTQQIQASGGTATLKTVQGGELKAQVTDGGVTLTDAKGNVAKVTTADLKASNGVIHVVDKVLMP